PRKHTIESANSVLRIRHSLRTPAISTRLREAAMTTAARAAEGRSWTRLAANTSIRAIAAAPTSPVSWVLAPACSATGVLEELLLTGKPWNKPVAVLAAPR